MKKIDKFIKVAGWLALFLILMAAGLVFYESASVKNSYQANFSLPANKDKAADSIKSERTLKMLFAGDIMLDRNIGEKIKSRGLDYLFARLEKENFDFKKYDLVSANLEGAVTNQGAHYPPVLANDFAFSPETVGNLKKYNFKIFNLANNHFSDQGERGMKESRVNLESQGFKYYGCADGQAGDCSYFVYEVNGLKIGFAGFSWVYRKFNEEAAQKIIRDLKNNTDAVIVNLHWGAEYNHIFNKAQAETARALVDAGADLIIGHHPHVVEGVEKYKNKLIFYSLGNFIFDQYFSRDTQEALAVEFNFTDSGQATARLLPLAAKQGQPALMAGPEKKNYLEKIAGWSKGEEKFIEQIKQGELD